MEQLFVVLGGGPVGCYLAYKLLTQTQGLVAMFEGRLFTRPQVVRIPYVIANDLPIDIKEQMWHDEATRKRIFTTQSIENADFWPKPGYLYWPWLSIGSFQTAMVDFMQSQYQERFFFIPKVYHFDQHEPLVAIQALYPKAKLPKTTAVFCSCGNFAKDLRKKTNLTIGKAQQDKGHGIYLIYQNVEVESYLRQDRPISYTELAEQGISYAAANNVKRDVQLYVYPAGELSRVFASIPECFIAYSQYSALEKAVDMTGKGLPAEAMPWFNWFSTVLTTSMGKADLQLPKDLSSIKVFYAARTEYYWQKVVQQKQSLFFVGDSAGSTDYKMGLSVGRGLLAAQYLVTAIVQHKADFERVADAYQEYWDNVVEREFNKGPGLTSEPWIQYLYLAQGREVKAGLERKLEFSGQTDYSVYLTEYRLTSSYTLTSESHAVVYVNTKAIYQNISQIAALANSLYSSQIVAVVKGDGYGLGANLIAKLALQAGVKFLGVAKLDEAIALRKAGFGPPIRIMVFEPPLVQDLSLYAQHEIEVLLPSSQNGSSVVILENWLRSTLRRPFSSLKVHVMVDTGLRRDGGYASNLPHAVYQTLDAIKQLPVQAVSLAGLATHLACYRCTDYNGEEVVDYRTMQLQRLRQVLEHALNQGLTIPMLHVGGGLALLAEHWPKLFGDLTLRHGLQLYTRVGHGIYGMELEQELNSASPSLSSSVEMSLQVRNIFYVEEGEPVSYGGHWRAPSQGAWIATLSGGWYEGVPRTAKTLGLSTTSMMVGIRGKQYPVVGTINMNAMMVNLGLQTSVQPGDRAVLFSWRKLQPQLPELAAISGHISPSITVNIPLSIPRIAVDD